MAGLAETKAGEGLAASDCCGAEAQAECCEPTDKAECCTPESSSCDCAEGEAGGEGIRDAVRSRYAAAATSVAEKTEAGESCCGSSTALTNEEAKFFGASLYDEDSQGELPDTATMASLGCGNPTAVAELGAGETVLDLGSGGGIDVLLSAKRVGPSGKAYGLDMTDEMLAVAEENKRKSGLGIVEFL
jgi:arsenite methyltransferase